MHEDNHYHVKKLNITQPISLNTTSDTDYHYAPDNDRSRLSPSMAAARKAMTAFRKTSLRSMAVRSARVRIDLITEFSNSAKSSKVDKSIAVEGCVAVRLKTCSKFTVILAIISFGFW